MLLPCKALSLNADDTFIPGRTSKLQLGNGEGEGVDGKENTSSVIFPNQFSNPHFL